jgi:hypothetical protein
MSKNCKCRDKEKRRCPRTTALSLAIAGESFFETPVSRRVAFFSRNNSVFPTVGVLLFRGDNRNNSDAFSSVSQTVV